MPNPSSNPSASVLTSPGDALRDQALNSAAEVAKNSLTQMTQLLCMPDIMDAGMAEVLADVMQLGTQILQRLNPQVTGRKKRGSSMISSPPVYNLGGGGWAMGSVEPVVSGVGEGEAVAPSSPAETFGARSMRELSTALETVAGAAKDLKASAEALKTTAEVLKVRTTTNP